MKGNKEILIPYLFSKNKVYYLHNEYHLGDNVFNFILFYNLKDYIEANNIKIFYYANRCYLPQLKEFLCSPNIYLASIEYKPSTSIQLWINNPLFMYRHDKQNMPVCFNKFYLKFFNNVLNMLHINYSLSKFCYSDLNLLADYDNLEEKYKSIDILFLNSQPLSNQYNYNKIEWDNYIRLLNNLNKYKIVTTTKVSNEINCTLDDNLTVKKIASVSLKASIIIAVNSGVVPGLLNINTLQNVKRFYTFDRNCYYSYPHFVSKNNINDISFDELASLLNK